MMNNKASLYVMVAIAVGYVLISALPAQLSMYTDQRQLLSNQPPDRLVGEGPDPEGGMLGSSNSTINDFVDANEENSTLTKSQSQESEVTQYNDRTVIDLMSIYKWWILDLTMALTVYFIAKRRFL